jgi:hypothetical protein
MNYRIYNTSKEINYTGCQCFKDCDCREEYPKVLTTVMVEVIHNGASIKKPLNVRRITNGSVKNYVEGIISSYESKFKTNT